MEEKLYRADLQEYSEKVLETYGVASQSAEREIIRLADEGNSVARKLYADMLFYGKLVRKEPLTTAFELYRLASDLTIPENGEEWSVGEHSYPAALWSCAYYLLDYRRKGVLLKCGEIPCIEKLDIPKRLALSLRLALLCISDIPYAGALNLAGRILQECAAAEETFHSLKAQIKESLAGKKYPTLSFSVGPVSSCAECAECAEQFFQAAAEGGYVYACNNLAAMEASRIVRLSDSGESGPETDKHISHYISALSKAADSYEPYAANRLGVFYITGEIQSPEGKAVFRSYVNFGAAKECFRKACVCPDLFIPFMHRHQSP
ncbi:MAG: hypothetical protein K6E50_03825 [Lachnospiraceae bacterium]|nr:hypothetical protein [Lachnospiraceae bacterium]